MTIMSLDWFRWILYKHMQRAVSFEPKPGMWIPSTQLLPYGRSGSMYTRNFPKLQNGDQTVLSRVNSAETMSFRSSNGNSCSPL